MNNKKEIVMKTTSLFQLGGIALLIPAVLYAIANLMYFLAGQPDAPTTFGLWLNIVAIMFEVFGFVALFARQVHRGGVLGLVGFVLMMVADLYFVGSISVSLGVAAGVVSNEQIGQVASYNFANSIFPWFWTAGLVLFGISIYRAQVLPKHTGVLLVLLAIVQQLTGPLAFTRPIFAIISFAAWASLGWALLMENRGVALEPVPAM
jgi:hypothetical protein